MRNSVGLIALSAILSACGGGGGGDSGSSIPVGTPLTLTPSNYVAVAQETLSSSFYLVNSADLVTGAQLSDPSVIIRFGQAQLPKLSQWLADVPAQVTGATQSQTEACPDGGTLTVTANDANGNSLLDAGDSASLTVSNCAFEGNVMNGGLSFTINSATGDLRTQSYSASITLTFNQLTAQSASASITGNGSLTLSGSAKAANDQSFSLSIASFALSSTYGGATYSRSLTNYTLSDILSPAGTGFSSTEANGTLSSSAFESKFVTITTSEPFVRSSSQTYPASGQVTATGANGSQVRISVIDNSSVNIELDADANGTFETSVTKLWSELV
ncbi:MAG: hypothetical protein JJD98_07610 [Polaromonas sp.]|nr:hypothetical protein [Polaromonas sp.]